MGHKGFRHSYKVGDFLFSISSLFEIDIESLLPSYKIFGVNEPEQEHLFQLALTKELPPTSSSKDIAHYELDEADCIIKETELGYEIVIIPLQDNITRRMIVNKKFSEAKAELFDSSPIDVMVLNNFVMMLYAFASAPHNTLLVHASVINYKNKGYLFLGKSGTGKSTHSRLWLENIDTSELLNDDNPVVRIESDGKATVYGSPWSGKTPCYKNQAIEVGGIVRLEQTPYNKITKQTTIQAFSYLLSSCSCLKEAENVREGIYDTVSLLTATMPVYKLECLPDSEAAVVSKKAIVRGG